MITALHRQRPTIFWRSLAFLAAFFALQLTWDALRGGALEQAVIHDGIARPAAFLVNLFTPNVHATAIAFAVHARGGGLNILNGCEGMEAAFMLFAAFAVAPIPWRPRWLGLLLGIPFVYVINQARILALFYAYRADHALFDPLHSIVAPIAIVLLVSVYFYAWVSHGFSRTSSYAT